MTIATENSETNISDPKSNSQQENEETDKNGNKTNEKENIRKNLSKNDSKSNFFFLLFIIGATLGILLEILNLQYRYSKTDHKPKYWVYSSENKGSNKSGYLKHVHLVLERVGYEDTSNDTDWNLLWSHSYPYNALKPHLYNLKPHQKVNHIPGIGYITNKVDLATTVSKYIPKAFKLPKNKDEFLKYAAENKDAIFVQKDNKHRHVMLKNVSEIDLESGKNFIQEYVQKPFLVDGYKFDIGVYVAITSVSPLRVYWYKGDVLFRYCPQQYYPFDPSNLDKYVIGDDYLPTWKVPSLVRPYVALGFSMKDAFDIYVRSKGKDPEKMWEDVREAILEAILAKEQLIIATLKNYKSDTNFFEMMRFDLIVDEDLKVYLLEANMSPNLSSAHYPPNQLLYEQVLYNLFGLVGISRPMNRYKAKTTSEETASARMVSDDKNIAVWGNECESCKESCDGVCALCTPCRTSRMRTAFLRAHTEHLHRGDFRRLFPPSMSPVSSPEAKEIPNLSAENKLQWLWYQGKCNVDVTWCT